MSFKIIGGKGFHITFSNGITISVQFGESNYCERRNLSFYQSSGVVDVKVVESKNAEVALWNDESWITRKAFIEVFGEELNDDVKGYVSSDEVASLIEWASTEPNNAK